MILTGNGSKMTAKETTELLKIIFGTIGGFCGMIAAIVGLLKLYYELNCHCKAKPTDVSVVVRDDQDRRYADVDWTEPRRNVLHRSTCKVKSYSVKCSLPDCKDVDLEVENEEPATIPLLNKYKDHCIQVTVNYVGRVFSVLHSSEPSDINENCLISAPPSEPNILDVNLTKDEFSLQFESPVHRGGDIKKYRVRYGTEGANDEIITFEDYNELDGHLSTNLSVTLMPDATYVFSLAAVVEKEGQECQGKWSEKQSYHVPKYGQLGSSASWSTTVWMILEETIVKNIGVDCGSLSSYLLGSHSLPYHGDNKEFTRNILIEWKKREGENANIPTLMEKLKKMSQINLYEILEDEYKKQCEAQLP